MRFGNVNGRASLLVAGGAIDVERASAGAFSSDPQAVYEAWGDFVRWAVSSPAGEPEPYAECDLGSPAPRPGQVFAIGLNYADHASEAGFSRPVTDPPVFTKFSSCISGPYDVIELPAGGNVDWETELVLVIGQRTFRAHRDGAWSVVAGVAVGQDLSERKSQMAGPSPQFSLAKSFPGFGPIGPFLVPPEELPDRDDLAIRTTLNGEVVQDARTSQLIFDVPGLIEKLSAVAPLLPGDIIFTGTPAGVGMGRTPPRWLAEGDLLISSIEGIGELRQRCVAADPSSRQTP